MSAANLKFFIPTNRFIPALKKVISKTETVVDCGCGEGHVMDLLNENKIQCIGVDLLNMGMRPDVFTDDAINYVYNNKNKPNCMSERVALVCRPCAGDWYFKIFKKTQRGLFVAKPEHYKRDILGLRAAGHKVTLIQKFVGVEHESLYYVGDVMKEEPEGEVYHFALVQIKCWDSPWWVEDKGDNYWHNYSGGRTPKSDSDKIFERCSTAGDYEALDWSKTNLVDNKYESGWLTPSGQFYGCDYMHHDKVATLYLKQKVEDLMKLGWARIADKSQWFCYRDLTEPQNTFMMRNGYRTDRLLAASPYNEVYNGVREI